MTIKRTAKPWPEALLYVNQSIDQVGSMYQAHTLPKYNGSWAAKKSYFLLICLASLRYESTDNRVGAFYIVLCVTLEITFGMRMVSAMCCNNDHDRRDDDDEFNYGGKGQRDPPKILHRRKLQREGEMEIFYCCPIKATAIVIRVSHIFFAGSQNSSLRRVT